MGTHRYRRSHCETGGHAVSAETVKVIVMGVVIVVMIIAAVATEQGRWPWERK